MNNMQRALEYLTRTDEWVYSKEIADGVGQDSHAIVKALHQLWKEKRIRRKVGAKRYGRTQYLYAALPKDVLPPEKRYKIILGPAWGYLPGKGIRT